MQLRQVESSSFAQLMAHKQSEGERKFESLRNLSDEEREAINERSSAACQRIASEFGKSKRFVFGSHA
jgi:hypothetical protein